MKGYLILLLVWIDLSLTKHQNHEVFDSDLESHKHSDKHISNAKVKKITDEYDVLSAKRKAKAVHRARASEEKWNYLEFGERDHREPSRQGFRIDPILNRMNLGRRNSSVRRAYSSKSSESSDSRSTSRELANWKDEWRDLWTKHKEAAMNTSDPGGDRVVFVAARPWGVPCGDPSMHDMPWGSCVMPAECDAEFRIYRGDYFCGRTQFVCCSLAFTTYDTYQGIGAVSLDQTSMETDSVERMKRKYKSKSSKSKQRRDRRHRKRMREQRKRKIRRTIARIVREVRRILNKSYKNMTKMKKRKTKKMKAFIRFLKRQFRMDRHSAKDVHEQQLWQVDNDLLNKLYDIRDVNHEFMTNETFRQVILSKKYNFRAAKMLLEAYPELESYMVRDMARSGDADVRRSMGTAGPRARRPRRKYLDYDVEYGLMYS